MILVNRQTFFKDVREVTRVREVIRYLWVNINSIFGFGQGFLGGQFPDKLPISTLKQYDTKSDLDTPLKN